MSGKLTTHVLNSAKGRPAPGVKIELWKLTTEKRELVRTAETNADGRTEAPLLAYGELKPGSYELLFFIGAYLIKTERETNPFLNEVPIRFTIHNAEENYHVPLLVSPWAYSTYRGS